MSERVSWFIKSLRQEINRTAGFRNARVEVTGNPLATPVDVEVESCGFTFRVRAELVTDPLRWEFRRIESGRVRHAEPLAEIALRAAAGVIYDLEHGD